MIATSANAFSADFVDYYNKPANWENGAVESGALCIREKVELNRNIILKNTLSIVITDNGELYNNGYELALTGDPVNPSNNDPREIYLNIIKTKVLPIILNYLLDENGGNQ